MLAHAHQPSPVPLVARPRILDWRTATATELRALDPRRTVVMVSCSPIEVHGPHLPLDADVREAEGLSLATAERLLTLDPDISFVRLPPICLGADVLPQAGSLRFSHGTIVRVLEELGATLARQGFVHIWISNFHGGPRHVLAIEKAAHRVNRRHRVRMISVFSLLAKKLTGGSSDLADRLGGLGGIATEELRGDAHGGLVETAMLLHLGAEHVDASYSTLPPRSLEIQMKELGRPPIQKGARPTLAEQLRSLPYRQRYFETETYAGAPAKATAALGRAYLEALSSDAADALLPVYRGEVDPGQAHSPLWKLRHVLLNRAFGWLFERLFARRRPAV